MNVTLHDFLSGIEARRLSEIEITFSKPVEGIKPGDFLLNGQAATEVLGNGAGPYLFSFSEAGDKTRLTLHQAVFESLEARDAHNDGWTTCLERLAAYVAQAA